MQKHERHYPCQGSQRNTTTGSLWYSTAQTPRGSIRHHFPRAKQQLVEEAVAYAGLEVNKPLERLMNEQGVIAGLRAFIGLWRNVLDSTRYEAGRPVLAVAVEQYFGDDNAPNAEAQPLDDVRAGLELLLSPVVKTKSSP